MLQVRQYLNKTMDWTIGDGLTIQIWHHRWASYTWSRNSYTVKPTTSQTGTISELIDTDVVTWDILKLQENFLPIDIQEIVKINVPDLHRSDIPVWTHHPKGAYTVHSAYQAFCGFNNTCNNTSEQGATTEKFFNKVWKLNVPGKIKAFLMEGHSQQSTNLG
ncbi:hypothetical protein LIER_18106 [Lithospermum erythrorhizon]|uniref:Uncharacterized protein n=1 Tax=Lithospermum erythrorhizon TaxID=34254 RepID=A0AAV3QIA3_LITER